MTERGFDSVQQPVDLRQQAYDLLTHAREPMAEEKKALKARGLLFLPVGIKSFALKFLPVARKSFVQVVAEDEGYFLPGQLDYAKASPDLRDYVLPRAVEVGLNPAELALPGSFNRTRPDQLEMIEEYSQLLQVAVPTARAIMLPSTGWAQLDRAYNATTGEVLFRNYFARALDNLSELEGARAGRRAPGNRFIVVGWRADYGNDSVGAVPAIVFVEIK